ISFLAGKRISKELTDGLQAFLEEIEVDQDHFVRRKLTENLENFASDLLIVPGWNEKFDQLKSEIITQENIKVYTDDAWQTLKETLVHNLEERDSILHEYLKRNIQKLSENLTQDEEMGIRINKWIRHFLYRMILKNRDEVENLIRNTVNSWEGKELSDKLELEVGKDLQFIRINGTLVGGLVGLIIYTVTQLFT